MDKDYRSLEHKIRDVVTESMARNSAKRMQVTNVARPDTATDPTDVKSKIAKQGEIKTKIIDEEQLDELGPDTLSSYKSKAADSEKQLTDKSSSLKVPAQDRNDAAVKANQRRQGMQLATKKLGEEAEDKQYIKTVSPTGAVDHKEVHSSKAYDAINSFKKRGYKATIVSRKTASVKEEVEQVDEAGLPSGMLGKYSGTPSQKTVNFRGTISQTNKQLKDYKARGYVVHKHTEDNGKHNYTMKHPDVKEEVEQVDEVSSALLYRAKQAAQKKAGWLMPGDKGKGDKAWNRVKKFRDAGVKKQDQERKQALTKEELVLSITEARKGYAKGYQSPWDKIEKAKPGIGKRIDAHVDALKKNANDYQAVVKKDVKEGAVPDNWEENSPQKRKATAKKVAADSMDHDKTAKIVEAAKADGVKPGDMDDSDPKKLKGGVTQVDLNPKTDDRTEDETTQDKAGKSAAAKANKEIGQKTKPVKEEAMSEKNFGLPESLINLVAETLKGGQKKIDKNHNGKIDGQDFAILRGETKAKVKPQYDKTRPAFKEEVEQVDEATDSFFVRSVDDNDNEKMHGTHSSLDSAMSAAKKIKDAEVVQTHGKANSHGYHKIKAFHSTSGKKSRPGDEDHIHPKHGLGYGGSHLTEATDSFHVRSVDDNDNERMHGTHSSLDSAMSAAKKIKGAEVVQTHGKANSNGYYKIKAFHSTSGKKSRPGDEDHIHPKHGLGYGGSHLTKEEAEAIVEKDNMTSKNPKDHSKLVRPSGNPNLGSKSPEDHSKLVHPSGNPFKPVKKMTKEEAEQIDELSNKTLKSYISKANDGWHPDSTLNLAAAAANKMNSRRGKDIESAVRLRKKAEKRGEGVVKAASKMAKEEVEFSAEEIARIEEIAKKL